MNKITITAIALAAALATADASAEVPKKWQLVWADEFNSETLDPAVWSRTTRGTPDWANTQSDDPRLVELRDGVLVLKGIVNDNTESDPAPYITGGIWTKDLKSFDPGRFEFRARLHGAKGAWPAIWLLPYDHRNEKNYWPNGGEIDILERLNNNHGVYQTVHSHWTYDLGKVNEPKSTGIYPIDREDWNTYAVDILEDKVIFYINGEQTLVYPKINDGAEGQFPFYIPQYILIDMQLGGQWVGDVDKADLPVEMEVDYVRYYQLR